VSEIEPGTLLWERHRARARASLVELERYFDRQNQRFGKLVRSDRRRIVRLLRRLEYRWGQTMAVAEAWRRARQRHLDTITVDGAF